MKQGIRKVLTGLLLISCLAYVTGCAAKNSYTDTASQTEGSQDLKMVTGADLTTGETAPASAESTAQAPADGKAAVDGQATVTDAAAAGTDRKLITTQTVTAQTSEFDTFTKELESEVSAAKGYMESSEVTGSKESGQRSASYTVRIPAERLSQFMNNLSGKATITYNSKNTQDVTLAYVDTESHLKALRTEETTLLSLMEKATEMADVIAIQNQLTQVRYQIESYESQLKVYDNQIDYSTLNLTVQEVERETAASDGSFWSQVKTGFAKNLYGLLHGIRSFAVWLLSMIPVFLPILLILLAVFLVIRRNRRRKVEKLIGKSEHKKSGSEK